MAVKVTMPKLGMTMEEGLIVGWLKEEGDSVAMDEPLFAVENAKASVDVESPGEGILLKIVANEGDVVPVGGLVAYIGQEGEDIGEDDASAEEVPKASDSEAKAEAPAKAEAKASEKVEGLRATPAARALARKKDISLLDISAQVGNRRIKRADVENYKSVHVASRQEEAPYVDIVPTNIRRIAAEKMCSNFNEAPHFYLVIEADATRLQSVLKNARGRMKDNEIKPTFTDVLAWIISRVIKEHPMINSQWKDGKIRQFRDVNFGIAADTPDGLVVPVIHKADSIGFAEIVKERSRLISDAREGKLSMDDMSGGTFTLSNLGMFGIDNFHAILNTPESALLTVGKICDTLVLENNEVKTKPILKMSLSCDHRVLDGATGAKFLQRLKAVMEDPAKLLDKDLF